MADEDDEIIGDEAEDGGGGGKRKRRLSGRSLVLFVVLPVLLLGGGAGAWYMGLLGPGDDMPEEVVEVPKSFFDLPEMIVNLSDRDGSRSQYLKLQVSLELEGENVKHIVDPVLPRIVDMFQVYLREMRASDLEGSAGIFRLKEELIRRVNLELASIRVSDVLFKEIIIQ